MDAITSLLFGPNRGVNVLSLDWDHLIILDACRYDVFKLVYSKYLSKALRRYRFECIESTASMTGEFWIRNINNANVLKKINDVIFVNSNPMIDKAVGQRKLHKVFYNYVPVWKRYWDGTLGTVKPEDVYRVALRTFIRYPNKRMIIWFLQPHYPYLDEKYAHINALGREWWNKNMLYMIPEKNRNIEKATVLAALIKSIVRLGCLHLGNAPKLGAYMRRNTHEVIRAYTSNLIKVLYYVKKLTEVLPGKIVVTSDHGEAFGEPLSKLLPLRVYGHISRIRIRSLTQVPFLVVKTSIPRHEALRKALRYLAHYLIDEISRKSYERGLYK